MASWRDRARPIVAKVLKDTAGQDEATIKKALFDAYPFGPRQYTPYKIWLEEIRRQRNLPPTHTMKFSGADAECSCGKWMFANYAAVPFRELEEAFAKHARRKVDAKELNPGLF